MPDLAQQHQALAVVHVEGLEFAAFAVEEQAAVGQRAVDVEAGQADARGAFADVGGVVVEVASRACGMAASGDQTTRARNRS